MLSRDVRVDAFQMPILERTTVDIREEIALLALDRRYTLTEVAERFGVSRPTVRLWRDRYRERGRSGLVDRSHAPLSCPHRTSEEIEQLIVAEREEYGWGSKKILRRLQDAHPELDLPGRSAVDALLRRYGLVRPVRRDRRRAASPFQRRYPATEPGELTTIDHKGQFRMANGRYCYPLTIVDHVSRYLLACAALSSTRLSEAWPVITRVFREHGLPTAMQSDNGPPFGSPNGGLSTMSVRLMTLGVLPVFGRPAHPQDNGRHERMHKDLKAETTRPPASNLTVSRKASTSSSRATTTSGRTRGSGWSAPPTPSGRLPVRIHALVAGPSIRATSNRERSAPLETSNYSVVRSSSPSPSPARQSVSRRPTKTSTPFTSTTS
jgi:putative transposase